MVDPALHMFVDTETTGLGHLGTPPRIDGIVQIAFAWRNSNGKVKKQSWLCNPGKRMLSGDRAVEAFSKSNLKMKDIQSAPAAMEVATEVRLFLKENVHSRVVFHAYNQAFDRPFLEASPWRLKLNWGDDVMIMASRYLGYTYDRLALEKALTGLGLDRRVKGPRHRADSDAYAALLVWEEINK
ncbi:MAG: 3'-5' exonuclease [Nitrososphaerota archaeon]|nr:3'-5' exonuclease [Nitrososphaerota archaeon]